MDGVVKLVGVDGVVWVDGVVGVGGFGDLGFEDQKVPTRTTTTRAISTFY